jgi:hypothetical protein
MPVTLISAAGSTKRYVGYSADAKPTGTGADAGAEFVELNTGNRYMFDGSAWQTAGTSNDNDLLAALVSLGEQQLQELRKISALLYDS